MIHKGSTAINYLAKKQQLDDSAASSHWQEYHRDFSFGDQGFVGLRGFGVHDYANREHKVLPDGTDVIFDDYPWDSADKIILEGLVPWHQQYYRFVPPSFRTYDGPVKHRLSKMSKK